MLTKIIFIINCKVSFLAIFQSFATLFGAGLYRGDKLLGNDRLGVGARLRDQERQNFCKVSTL